MTDRDYDDWLQDSGAYERFAGLDVEPDEERNAREAAIERDIDRWVEEHGSGGE